MLFIHIRLKYRWVMKIGKDKGDNKKIQVKDKSKPEN